MKEAKKGMGQQKGMGVGHYNKWESGHPEKTLWGNTIKLRPQGSEKEKNIPYKRNSIHTGH